MSRTDRRTAGLAHPPADPHHRPPHSPAPHHRAPLRHRLRRMLIAGLLILAPAALTVYVLIAIFRLMDGVFGPLVDRAISVYIPDAHVPGLGLVMTLLVVLLLGWLSTRVVGRRMIAGFENLIQRVPVVRTVYASTKGVLEALSKDKAEAFTRVVLVEYPKANVFALGFVTRGARWEAIDPRTADMLLVFVPTTPNPTSGFLLLVPRSEAITLPISVEEGIRMVISGGILVPEMPELHGAPPVAAPGGGAAGPAVRHPREADRPPAAAPAPVPAASEPLEAAASAESAEPAEPVETPEPVAR